ncbi:MAG: hypothetical protein LBM08_09870 [Dysgonamonadaceae bacterium]|nr:hypothetical protein [Dysgonamonadaceae bacterium]
MKKTAGIIILILLSVIAIQEYRIRGIEPETTITTIVHDTITVTAPEPVSVAETGQIRAKLPVAEKCTAEPEKVPETCAFESVKGDSIEVVVPISTKVYEDSLYRAVISGYNASLDTIQIYRQTVYIDRWHEGEKTRSKRWSIGVQVGYGTDFRVLRPYIGVGISYKLWEF